MVGVGVEFGDNSQPDVGITGKVLGGPGGNGLVVGGGATYFPWSADPVGLDLSAGLDFNGLAALGGYDFLRHKPQVSAGFAPTPGGQTCPSPYTLRSGDCVNENPSDRRLKRDVTHLATLHDGIKLYSFRYLWSDTVYVGVMAQDLLADRRFSHAVGTSEDGYFVVDYDKLDLVMTTLEDWDNFGLDAIVLGSRPKAFLAERAA